MIHFKQWLAHTTDWIVGPLTMETFEEIRTNLAITVIMLVLIVVWFLGIFISPIVNIFRLPFDARAGKQRLIDAKEEAEKSSALHDIMWYVNRSKENLGLMEAAGLALSCYYERQALAILQEREMWLRLRADNNDQG